MKGFRDFILRGNVVDLAIAVVIGTAFGAVVTALVKDLITPLIAAIGGQPDFSNIYFTIKQLEISRWRFSQRADQLLGYCSGHVLLRGAAC